MTEQMISFLFSRFKLELEKREKMRIKLFKGKIAGPIWCHLC